MSTLPVNGTVGIDSEEVGDGHRPTAVVGLLPQETFISMLGRERKRTERSRRRFVLMLLESANLFKSGHDPESFQQVVMALSKSTRETDIIGWYEEHAVLGVIFTEIGDAEGGSVASALLSKVPNALSSSLNIEQINEISLTFHVFPEEPGKPGSDDHSGRALYPDLLPQRRTKNISRLAKRSLDIVGSLLAIALFSPMFFIIWALVRLTSTGPALFRQSRVGQGGTHFTFLKFRSMYKDCDHAIHREYVKSFIAGAAGTAAPGGGLPGVFKLTHDPRVTPVGRVLRRYSLDELPQFFNVLSGEMSLVGPRPPLPYEFERHDIWHKRRLTAVKPGITGLWQVEGRSRVEFDDMIRLDLRYATEWSLWLDLKILFKTPRAVFAADGAY